MMNHYSDVNNPEILSSNNLKCYCRNSFLNVFTGKDGDNKCKLNYYSFPLNYYNWYSLEISTWNFS